MSTAGRILDVIDAGLQSSDEHGYGTDHTPGRCARCQLHEPDLGDLCTGCRAFLLEDSDEDPAQQTMRVTIAPEYADLFREAQEHWETFSAGIRGAQADMVIIDEVATLADLAEPIEQYLDFRRHSIRYWVESGLDRQLRQRNDMELWHYGVT